MNKLFIVIGGNCPRRLVDAQTIKNYFHANELSWTDDVSKADFITVVTCAGFNSSEVASIRTINSVIENKKKEAVVIATSCLTKVNPESIKKYLEVKMILWENLYQMNNLIKAKIGFENIPEATEIDEIPPLIGIPLWQKFYNQFHFHKEFFKRAMHFIKIRNNSKYGHENIFEGDIYNIMIARGCASNCSFCSIRYAHGRVKSNDVNEIMDSFQLGLNKGYKKFVLIAEDVGAYGIDINTNIVELLRKLFSVKDNFKIIINDFNPRWLVKYFNELLPLLTENENKIEDLRIPVQSGSNKILNLMRRRYTVEEVSSCIDRLWEHIPSLKIRTHCLLGFPGETLDDFDQTIKFINRYPKVAVEIFDYQERFFCDSVKLPNKVTEQEIRRRVKVIRSLSYA